MTHRVWPSYLQRLVMTRPGIRSDPRYKGAFGQIYIFRIAEPRPAVSEQHRLCCLRLLIESESLLNDGTAAVAFVAVLSVLAGENHDVHSIAGALLLTIAGGALIGALVGFGFMLLAGRTDDYLVEITFTTLAAYGSFFVAEHYHCSGVLAALTAGLVVGNYRPSGSMSDAGRHALETFWEYAAFLANSLIFILIGAQEAEQHFSG